MKEAPEIWGGPERKGGGGEGKPSPHTGGQYTPRVGEFLSFFHLPFLNIIFPTFDASWYQKARWVSLGAQQDQKLRPKSAKWRQNATPKTPVVLQNTVPGTDLLPRSLSECSWASFWSIWDGFLMNFKGFGHQFGSIFDNSAITLQTTEAEPKTIKNKQIPAETTRTSRELQITNIICFVYADFEYNIRLA